MTTDSTGAAAKSDAVSAGLFSASFLGLLVTQFLTATNDNIFRWLVIGIGKQHVVGDNAGNVLMAGSACFVLPYLLLSAPAGYLADRYSKRTVIVTCKVAEIVVMALGVLAIIAGNLWFLFAVVALMGAQSALFSPAKLGGIPEMLEPKHISNANGLMGLTTVIATVVGMAVGNVLTDLTGAKGMERWWLSAAVLIGVALVGWWCSLWIHKLPVANANRSFPWDAPVQAARDLKALFLQRALLRVALGIMFFWSIGMLAQLNIDQFAFEGGASRQSDIVPLLLSLVAGVGVGSVMAGIWSAGHVELGILPLGAGGVAVSSVLLFSVQGALFAPDLPFTTAYVLACVFLFGLGFSAGLFDVPLAAFMQHRSPRESRGSILAASNFLTFFGMLMMSFLFAGLRYPVSNNEPLFDSSQIFLLCGIFTVPVFVYIVWLIPQATIRFLVWLASRTVYRIRVIGRENLPAEGGALLVANHVSFVDGVLLLLTTSRPIRMIAYAGNLESRFLFWLANLFGVIPISPKPKQIVAALRTAHDALRNGELVCIFPEGGITRSGQIQAFRPGMMRILGGTDAPVVPVYLDGLWGSIFSFERGKFFWKWPRRVPYPVWIHFGRQVPRPLDVHKVRQAVQELGAKAVEQRSARMTLLTRSFIRTCKKRKWTGKVADSTGAKLTGGELLTRSLVLRRLLRRHVLAADERFVGVLLPPSLGSVVANTSLALDRRVAVNLNYTVSADVMNSCLDQAGIKHVLTSRKFMEKMPFDLAAEVVHLEDFKDRPTTGDKLVSALQAYFLPTWIVDRSLALKQVKHDDLLTVIFTSGSTGRPKGVMLSYSNIGTNVEAIEQVVQLTSRDVLLGILPFFHSFGYTVTLWTVMSIDVKGVYHFNPLEAKQVGKLCRQHGATILLSTPTFLRSYIRRCDAEDLKSLDVVVVGAEALPKDLADAFEQKFHVRPVEGYGATELSPLVSVNVPPSRSLDNFQTDAKEGTVGRPVPGVSAKVVDLESGIELGVGQSGMLLIRGPNVMQGYLGRADLTEEVMRDGWYVTGDVALIDDEGFIQITGRESRFSKIGGEMVPHIKIEEALAKILGCGDDEGPKVAVTAVPDQRKGERLVVVHTAISMSPQELCDRLGEEGLPNLFIPSPDSFVEIDELPVLGSGKLDLKGIQQIAREKLLSGG